MGWNPFKRLFNDLSRDINAAVNGPEYNNPSLTNPKSFGYYPNLKGDDALSTLQLANEAVLVMDLTKDGATANFTRTDIATLKYPATRRHCVLATLSVGLANQNRAYWGSTVVKAELTSHGSLVLGPSKDPSVDYVRFWTTTWKAIVFDYIDQIMDAGFTGVYLTNVDVYEAIEAEFPADPALKKPLALVMKDFLRSILAYAHSRNPSFQVFLEGGEAYYGDDRFIRDFDALVTRDLYYKDGVALVPQSYWPKLSLLLRMRRQTGVWLFDVETVTSSKDKVALNANFSYRGIGGYVIVNAPVPTPVVEEAPVDTTPEPVAVDPKPVAPAPTTAVLPQIQAVAPKANT